MIILGGGGAVTEVALWNLKAIVVVIEEVVKVL